MEAAAYAARADFASTSDAAAIVGGKAPESLARSLLWPDGSSEWLQTAWDALKSHLLAADEGWEVWTDWYEARLRGDPFDPDLERARVLIDEAIWQQGPKAVNAEIARLIAAHRAKPEMPEERPAPVHFGFRDGALRPEPAPAPTPPAEQAAALRSAWAALGAMIEDFTTDGGGAQVRGLQATLRRCRAAMGAEFGALDVVLLGVHHSVVWGYARRADDILIPEDASRLQAIDAQLGVFLAWFPEWLAYQASIAPAFAAPEVEQQAVADASAALDAIASAAPDLISPEAQEALAPLRDAATPEPSADDPNPVAPAAQRRGYLRSLRSGFRALSSWVLENTKAGAAKALQGSVALGVSALIGEAGAKLLKLAGLLPAEFGFLASVVTFLRGLFGA